MIGAPVQTISGVAWAPSPICIGALLALLCLCGVLQAQTINREQTRVLSAPNVRPGCFAPLAVVFDPPAGATAARVESVSPGVVLTRQVNITGFGPVEAHLPWLAVEHSFVRVLVNGLSDEFTPPMPSRPQSPSFGRVYAAVFAPDIAAARVLLKPGDELVCDFFPASEAFGDWRMLDGYDAVILLNDGSINWSLDFAQMLREFNSLGGVVFNAAQSDFASSGQASPPRVFEDLACVREPVGIGARYFASYPSFARHPNPRKAIIAALRDQRWLGADIPPSGKPASRAVIEPHERGWLTPLGPPPVTAPTLFFALAGLLVLIALLAPIIMARLTRRAWPLPLAIILLASGLGFGSALQPGPPAAAEMHCVQWRVGEIASRRSYVSVAALPGSLEIWRVELDAEGSRALPRKAPARQKQRAWVVDQPLTPLLANSAREVTLRDGNIDSLIFRDFAAKARRGQTPFTDDQALLLDWWLEAYAYRGRDTSIAGIASPGAPPVEWPDTLWRYRGAITVTPLRGSGR